MPKAPCVAPDGTGTCPNLSNGRAVRPTRYTLAMAGRKVPFPYPALPRGEFHPRRDLGHWHALVQRDARIVRWFIQDEMGLHFGDSPLGEFMGAYDQADPNMVVPPFQSIPLEQRRHLLHGSAQFE